MRQEGVSIGELGKRMECRLNIRIIILIRQNLRKIYQRSFMITRLVRSMFHPSRR